MENKYDEITKEFEKMTDEELNQLKNVIQETIQKIDSIVEGA